MTFRIWSKRQRVIDNKMNKNAANNGCTPMPPKRRHSVHPTVGHHSKKLKYFSTIINLKDHETITESFHSSFSCFGN